MLVWWIGTAVLGCLFTFCGGYLLSAGERLGAALLWFAGLALITFAFWEMGIGAT